MNSAGVQGFLFNKEYQKVVEKFRIEKPPIEETNIKEFWQALLELNNEKTVVGDPDTESAQLAQMYISEYYDFAMAVGCCNDQIQLQTLLRTLFLSIANTAMAVYKLAFDGFAYQAKVLLRNLYELCMTLLNVIIDKAKRTALFEAAQQDNEYETWRKYFKPSKLKKTLQDYEKHLGESISEDWHCRTYGHLSSYAHNDFLSFFVGAYVISENEEDDMVLNVCGNYADRVDDLLDDMNAILFYTGMCFLKMIGDPVLDVRKEHICANDGIGEDNQEFWNQATFLELLNRECYFKSIVKSQLPEDVN